MAEKVVDESVLLASIQVSFRRMASREFVDFVHGNELDEVFDELKIVLVSVSKVLNVAEIKQFSNFRAAGWIDELKCAIYDAEDLVFEIYTEALRCEMKVEQKSATGSSSKFSDEGWPSNLKSLSIVGCGKLFVNRGQWSLRTITSLTSLDFTGIDEVVDSFPEQGQIPTSLTSLKLSKLKNLRTLNGMAFRQLISLKMLSISFCDQLICFPEEGLPASLYQLDIFSCRLLKERCQRDEGQDWSKIARISHICIDKEYI